MDLSAYGFVLRLRGSLSMIAGTTAARLAYALVTVALVAVGKETSGSFLVGGAVGAAATATMALSSLPKGRLLDRLGPRWLLGLEAVICVLALLFALLLYLLGASFWWLFPLAIVAGIGDPSTVAIAKNAWWRKLRKKKERLSAMALEQTASGLSYTLGAAGAGLAIALLGPWHSLLLGLLLTAIPPALLTANSLMKGWRLQTGKKAPWQIRKLLPLGLVYGAFFAVSGALPVLLLAATEEAHSASLPLLLAAIYPGTMIGGMLYGTLHDKRPARSMSLALLAGTVILFFAALPASPPLLGAGLLLYGFARGPAPITASFLAFQKVGERSGGQATGFLLVCLFLGLGAGSFLAGLAVDKAGASVALFLPAVLCLLSLAGSLWNFRSD